MSLFFVHAIICKGDLLFLYARQYNNFQIYKSDYSENMFKTLNLLNLSELNSLNI